jgi:hypothetical protein
MTWVTAAIEALVGAACLAMGVTSWRRATLLFRVVAVVLVVAGATAVVNAVVSVA